MEPIDVCQEAKKIVKNWWIFLIVGITAIGIGVWIFANPAESFSVITILFAAFYIVIGIANMIYTITNREVIPAWGWPLAGAIVMIFLGVSLLIMPYVAANVVLMLFAISIMVMGVELICIAFTVPGFFAKLLAVVFGLLVIFSGYTAINNPIAGILSITTIQAIAMTIIGIYCIVIAVMLSRAKGVLKRVQ